MQMPKFAALTEKVNGKLTALSWLSLSEVSKFNKF
jgi:hypothetical protein